MIREEALEILNEKVKTSNLIKHSLAVEAVMAELANYFSAQGGSASGENDDRNKWALAGLLHDIDYEETKDEPEQHSLKGAQFLESLGIESEIVSAVKKHNNVHGLTRETKIEQALFCADPITGLIVAAALVLPDKKISVLAPDNVLNRFKEKGFARGANREHIAACNELDLTLEQFIALSLSAMQKISAEIGL